MKFRKYPKRMYMKNRSFLFTLAVGLGSVVTLVDNEVLRLVVFAAREVRVENSLGASSISLENVSGDRAAQESCRHTF
jgi:hypothetical protein